MRRTSGAGLRACLAVAALSAACGGSGAATPSAHMPTADPTLGAPLPESAQSAARPSATRLTSQPAAMRPISASARLFTSQTSSIAEAEVRVLRDEAAWSATWRALQPEPAEGPVPAVDFARDMVVVVAGGERTSGGHAVRVDGVSDAAGGRGLVLHVTRTAPGEGCMTTMAITAPVDVVRVPRADGPVRLDARDVAAAC